MRLTLRRLPRLGVAVAAATTALITLTPQAAVAAVVLNDGVVLTSTTATDYLVTADKSTWAAAAVHSSSNYNVSLFDQWGGWLTSSYGYGFGSTEFVAVNSHLLPPASRPGHRRPDRGTPAPPAGRARAGPAVWAGTAAPAPATAATGDNSPSGSRSARAPNWCPACSRPAPTPSMAYLEAATGAVHLDKPHEIAAYNTIWNDMAARALDESRSKSLIQQVAEEYSRA